MAIHSRALVCTAGVAVGVALLAFPWLAGPRPNPVPAAFADRGAGYQVVLDFARRLDGACRAGDLGQFAQCVTPAFLLRLQQNVQRAGGSLVGPALADYAAGQGGFANLLQRPLAAAAARRERVAVVVPAAAGRSGSQALAMVWDGERLRLDAVVHVPDVPADDDPAVHDLTQALLGSR